MKKVTCCAFLPFYDEVGNNATYYILEDGSKEIHTFPVKHFITTLLHSLQMDPFMLKYWSKRTLGMRSHLPLLLSHNITFIPIKIRSSVPMHDGYLGYVLISAIKDYKDQQVILKNGVKIDTLSSKHYITKKLQEARLLTYSYQIQKDPIDIFIHTNT